MVSMTKSDLNMGAGRFSLGRFVRVEIKRARPEPLCTPVTRFGARGRAWFGTARASINRLVSLELRRNVDYL